MGETTAITFNLPSSLLEEARKEGLLSEEEMEKTLNEEIRRRRLRDLLATADKLAKVDLPPVPDEEVVALVHEVRKERHTRNAACP